MCRESTTWAIGSWRADVVQALLGERGALAVLEAGDVGKEELEKERAARGEAIGHPLEAAHLVFLGEEGEEGVEGHEHQLEAPLDFEPAEVAEGHGYVLAARLLPQLRHHRWGAVDAVDFEAALDQGEGQAPRADAELEDRGARSLPREAVCSTIRRTLRRGARRRFRDRTLTCSAPGSRGLSGGRGACISAARCRRHAARRGDEANPIPGLQP